MKRLSWSGIRRGGAAAGVRLVLGLLAALFLIGGLRMTPEKERQRAEARLAESMASGKAMRRTDVVDVWVPRGLLAGAVCLGLAAVAWPSRRRVEAGAEDAAIPGMPRWHKGGLCLLLAGLAWHAWPRMHYGLWSDEQQSVADSIVGEVETTRDGRPGDFRPVPWTDTVFGYITPNNHVLYSICARLMHSLHPPPQSRTDPHHSTVLLRLVSLLAGLGAVAAVFAGGWRFGGPAVAWGSAVFLALHPWWLRFATEVRGYGLLLPVAALLLAAADRAVRSGALRWWMATGLLQFLCLWIWPLAVHLILWLNAGLVVWFLALTLRRRPAPWRGWLAGSLIGAACTFPLLLPLLPQLQRYLKVMGGQTDRARWPMENIAELLSGRRWTPPHHEPAGFFPSWNAGAAGWAVLILVGGLCAAGAWKLWRQPDRRWLLAPLLAAPPVLYLTAVLTDSLFHPWYTAPFLPGICLLAGLGLSTLARDSGRAATAAVTAWALFLLAATWWPRRFLLSYPVEPAREVAVLINAPQNAAAADDPREPIILVRSPHQLAVPTARRIATPEDIHAALAEARSTGRDVYYYECLQGLLALSGSPLAACLEDPALFAGKIVLHGTNYERPIGIYRWTGNRQPAYPGPVPFPPGSPAVQQQP